MMKRLAWAISAALIIVGPSIGSSTYAQNACQLTIESDDQMQFNQREMSVPSSCKEVTVTLKHTGSLPKSSMGHNWVLTESAKLQSVANAGAQAGIERHFVPSNPAVIAATTLIGGGEQTSVTFSVSGLAGKDLTFFCSFPGHWSVMKGNFKVL